MPGAELGMEGPASRSRIGGHERLTEIGQAAVAERAAPTAVACRGSSLGGVAGAAFARPAAAAAERGSQALPATDGLRRTALLALHRRPLRRPAARARLPQRRDLPATVAGMDRAGRLGAGAGADGRGARQRRQARLVTRRRRRLDRGREKRGDLIGPSPVNRALPSSKYHLAVEAQGWPLQVELGPGNENERAHLLPLVDALRAAGYQPTEVWADRGYCSRSLRDELTARGIRPQISQRRRAGQAPAPEQSTRPGRRGRQRVTRTSDPHARHRWVVERTNAWLRRFRRLTIRTEPNSRVYLAYLTIALLIILDRAL